MLWFNTLNAKSNIPFLMRTSECFSEWEDKLPNSLREGKYTADYSCIEYWNNRVIRSYSIILSVLTFEFYVMVDIVHSTSDTTLWVVLTWRLARFELFKDLQSIGIAELIKAYFGGGEPLQMFVITHKQFSYVIGLW